MLQRDIAVGCFFHKRSSSSLSLKMKLINKRDAFSYALSIPTQLSHFRKKETFSLKLQCQPTLRKLISEENVAIWYTRFRNPITCNRFIIQYFIQQTAQ
jgi:hypothetical protein